MFRISVCVILLFVCSPLPASAQDQTNEIRCSSATACQSGAIPRFATNGGSATVNNSIMSQSGGGIHIAGSESISGNLSSGGNISAASVTGGSVTATGAVSGGTINASSGFNMGGRPIAFGFSVDGIAFLGFAGSSTPTLGNNNTGVGVGAMGANNGGFDNTATGYTALTSNTGGFENTATGDAALYFNTGGTNNTANGVSALAQNLNGNFNTAVGYGAGITSSGRTENGSFNTFLGGEAGPGSDVSNATAVGALAEVDASNALVLGSINGVNSATADTNVGIGTTAPATTLHVKSRSTFQPLFVESSSNFGTWMQLKNTSAGARNWAILSAGSTNAEGAGNLGITNFTGASTIFLEGNVSVTGNLTKGGGSFKIDHPIEPANKYLSHSFVESPDMMNIYNGNITTDAQGRATVVLPGYFVALNRDFRYQLTVIGQFAQAIVDREISKNHFIIKTSKPRVKVSWQVTGIRQDAWANAHRIPVEEDKPPLDQGHYLHPELFGASEQQAIGTGLATPSTASPSPTTASLVNPLSKEANPMK
jgi:hypothetical protein